MEDPFRTGAGINLEHLHHEENRKKQKNRKMQVWQGESGFHINNKEINHPIKPPITITTVQTEAKKKYRPRTSINRWLFHRSIKESLVAFLTSGMAFPSFGPEVFAVASWFSTFPSFGRPFRCSFLLFFSKVILLRILYCKNTEFSDERTGKETLLPPF